MTEEQKEVFEREYFEEVCRKEVFEREYFEEVCREEEEMIAELEQEEGND